MQTETRYFLASAKLQDGSTYNQEWHDLWDGETATEADLRAQGWWDCPLKALAELVIDGDQDGDAIHAAIDAGETTDYPYDGVMYRYLWVARDSDA